jgi:HSP20 family molecular chaperone IbpA
MADLQVHTGTGMASFPADDELSPIWFRIRETPATIELTANVDGYEEDEIDLLLDCDQLTVTGYHEVRRGPGWSRELDDGGEDPTYLSFSNSFAVPPGTPASHVEADLFGGILTIIVEKPLDD